MGDLCLFLNLIIPFKLKIPKFEKYDRKPSLILHLTMHTRSIAAYIGNEKPIVYYF